MPEPKNGGGRRHLVKNRAFTISRKRCLKNWSERNLQMKTYSCREIINTENLDRIIKAKRLDPGQLTQLQRLRKRLKEHDGYAHKVDFALNPQERRGRLYPKRGTSSVQGLKRDVRKPLTHDSYTDITWSTRTRASSLNSSSDTASSVRTSTNTSRAARNISRVSCESSTTPSRPCLTTRQKIG